jgi:hypothetical protein
MRPDSSNIGDPPSIGMQTTGLALKVQPKPCGTCIYRTVDIAKLPRLTRVTSLPRRLLRQVWGAFIS